MNQAAIAIPEKLFFKIGEVCELAGVQAHVLRYWETEFPMLAPQKNRAGQRTYRRRDVEMALRIKQLLYDEQYTIAGAKKKLANDSSRGTSHEVDAPPMPKPPTRSAAPAKAPEQSGEQRATLRQIGQQLREILDLLADGDAEIKPPRGKRR